MSQEQLQQEEQRLEQAIQFLGETGELDEVEQQIPEHQEPKLETAIEFVPKTEETEADERQYLLLYVVEEEEKEVRSYEWITGRRRIYDFLVPMIKEGTIDCTESTVIVEGSPIEYGVSVYKFMKLMEKRFPEELFNIDNYVDIDSIDEENL